MSGLMYSTSDSNQTATGLTNESDYGLCSELPPF